jgi:hypothetical protein
MNGRIYDPLIGRFLSADTYVQFPYDLQSYNRYSYVHNNPLTYNDPSGYFLNFIVGAVAGAVIDGGAQIAASMISGKSFTEAVRSVDLVSVGISAGMGATGVGLGQVTAKATGSLAIRVGADALAGAVEGAIETAVRGDGNLAMNMATGAVANVLGDAAGDAVQRLKSVDVDTPSPSQVGDIPNTTTAPTAEGQLALPAPEGTNPYPDGATITAGPAPAGMTVEMAMSPGQPASSPGGFATTDTITSVSQVRNDLAVTPEFKAEIGYVQTYEIVPGTQIQQGPVGPQTYQGVTYPGGGTQVQILVPKEERKNVLIPIGEPRIIE